MRELADRLREKLGDYAVWVDHDRTVDQHESLEEAARAMSEAFNESGSNWVHRIWAESLADPEQEVELGCEWSARLVELPEEP